MAFFFYGLGLIFEAGFELPIISALFYVPSVISVTINSIIGVMIAWFKFVP